MSSSYRKTVGGKLTLKGTAPLASSKKRKHRKKRPTADHSPNGSALASKAAVPTVSSALHLVKLRGSGRLLSSGTTLMGQVGTKFLQELQVGDALVIQHPTSLVDETRIVRMVLSDVSASVSSAFSSDLVSSTPFYYIRAPPDDDATQVGQQQAERTKKRKKDEETAFGTYAGGTEVGGQLTYRVKKSGAYGGYAIVKEDTDVERSREDLLDIRAKKKGDRHCM
ncbi:unnamed protein product [Hyaloperonospora brassicae]|uniref:Uncharacterized protein n=1 Tax=Hyaloperonospora brassicae TaxID=162125 RepID=A0AAV0TH44_HYABA|nr:unnamed protein product [Hyaloperonospora brassicae]